MEQSKPIEQTVSEPVQATDNLQNNNIVSDAIFEDIPKSGKPETFTKEFSISDMKEEPSKIKVDFFGGENPNSFITQPTEPAKPDAPVGNYINNPSSGIINTNSPAKTREEIRGNVTTIIAILDYVLSLLGLWIAGEGTQNQYTADTSQKKLLETALVDYMYEKQAKLPPFVALILAFITAYGFMLGGALKKKIEKNKKKKEAQSFGDIPKKEKEEIIKPAPKPAVVPTIQRIEDAPFMQPIAKPAQNMAEKASYATLEKEPFVSSWHSPDPNIIAADKDEVERYIARGIFPM